MKATDVYDDVIWQPDEDGLGVAKLAKILADEENCWDELSNRDG